ncbi:TetR/AcrR family transcriptional regulator [Nocardia higoensis]|uniref:TetR/AcrR family transcriptional regulator n=1 Tax=Nocardia higoensis TaxID=228599 RepID=A0ABS0D8S1_9NOCA|nr:TetR/AcrR family transcriptional regulator [Nocardia higoensis]MBF6354213.1 TetR/AcrR family transcriptional regulator [Nocardia higoensis]
MPSETSPPEAATPTAPASGTAGATVRRGRPPQSRLQAEQVRDRIVRATAEVFSRNGSRGTTVARIVEQAELARPTFYRYFGNAEEPLHVLLTESNDRLTGGIRAALRAWMDPVPLGIGLIDAYLDWARGHGRMLGPLFTELHDPASPVSAYRERALDDIRAAVRAKFTDLGRQAPVPLDLDAALHLCEYVVFRISTAADGEPDPEVVDAARLTMIRFLLPILGTRADLEFALGLPDIFPEPD